MLILFSPALATTIPSNGVRAESSDNAETYIYLDLNQDNYEILPGKSINFNIIARNIGDVNVTYYPPDTSLFKLPVGWSLQFSPSTDLFINANSNELLAVTITAASNADANSEVEFTIIGTASSPDAEIIPKTINVRVAQIFEVGLYATDKIVFSSPTEQKNLEITITNSGNGDERLAIEIQGIPAGLKLSEEAQEFIIKPVDHYHVSLLDLNCWRI
jgi:uncharacterized membrane protein